MPEPGMLRQVWQFGEPGPYPILDLLAGELGGPLGGRRRHQTGLGQSQGADRVEVARVDLQPGRGRRVHRGDRRKLHHPAVVQLHTAGYGAAGDRGQLAQNRRRARQGRQQHPHLADRSGVVDEDETRLPAIIDR
jgi:hypothetical protein